LYHFEPPGCPIVIAYQPVVFCCRYVVFLGRCIVDLEIRPKADLMPAQVAA
jgi:hypothetical protein